ncbi:MAG: hypothetical protein ACK58T_33600, partial [Phycisphaerae bacterium]
MNDRQILGSKCMQNGVLLGCIESEGNGRIRSECLPECRFTFSQQEVAKLCQSAGCLSSRIERRCLTLASHFIGREIESKAIACGPVVNSHLDAVHI